MSPAYAAGVSRISIEPGGGRRPEQAERGRRPEQAEDDGQLAAALRIAVLRLSRRLRAERGDESLTLSQLSALGSLEHFGSCSPTALAQAERVQPPSMTRVIAALEQHGYAVRAPHDKDRRQAVIAITDAGRQMLDETRRRRTVFLAAALEDLSGAEREALSAAIPLLQRLAEH